jgi:hypothetical protein
MTPRAPRIPLPIPILYRRTDDANWAPATVVNLSESGVLFGPTALEPGVAVEVILAPPIRVGTLATGKQVCVGKVVRLHEVGEVAVRLVDCRFLLDAPPAAGAPLDWDS